MGVAQYVAVALAAVLAAEAAGQDVNETGIATPNFNTTTTTTNTTTTTTNVLLSGSVSSSSIATDNACPNVPNSVLLAGPSCVCAIGYSGTPIFDGNQWSGVCSPVACPGFSTQTVDAATGYATCVCNKFYYASQAITWNAAPASTWSGVCAPVACPNTAFTPSSPPGTCTCKPGYRTYTAASYDEVARKWSGACSFVSPPGNSTYIFQSSAAVCKTGFTGTINWVASPTPSWSGVCTEAACPAGAAKVAGNVTCACGTGYPGSTSWGNSAWTATCGSRAPCPASASYSSALPSGTCRCINGFTGTLTWANPTWNGFCYPSNLPACPANSVRSSTGTCVCNTGYPGGTISWTGSAWAGSCGVRQSCPLNAAYNTATPATCVCKSGFTGTPSWIGTGPWTGSCVEAACPANAARVSAGVCKCNVGNPGTTTWSGAAWSNSCAAQVNCPANASYNSTGYCKCNPSYSGGLTWTASGWTGTCSLTCPANSATKSATTCQCNTGYPGGLLTWSGAAWSGACGARAACPTNAVYNAAGSCACNSGFTGTPTWSGTAWGGRCTPNPECNNVRREWSTLSSSDKALYMEAVSTLSRSGAYTSVLAVHANMPSSADGYAHRSAGFYPWHRQFLFRYENQLRALNPKFKCLSIPYYDWSRDASGFLSSSTFSDFGGRFGGCMSTLGGYRFGYNCVTRSPSNAQTVAGSSTIYTAIAQSSSLTSLYNTVVSAHNAVHNNVGGTMGTLQSCFDPFFMMHHSFIDYTWWQYSRCRNDYSTGNLGTVSIFNVSPSSQARTSSLSASGRSGGGYTYALSAYASAAGFRNMCPNGVSSSSSSSSTLSSSSSSASTPGAFDPTQQTFTPDQFGSMAATPSGTGVSTLSGGVSGSSTGSGIPPGLYISANQAAGLKAMFETLAATNNTAKAQRAGCEAEKSVRKYTGPSAWATRMCSMAAEMQSFQLDVCTDFALPAGQTQAQFLAGLTARDTTCLASVKAAGGMANFMNM